MHRNVVWLSGCRTLRELSEKKSNKILHRRSKMHFLWIYQWQAYKKISMIQIHSSETQNIPHLKHVKNFGQQYSGFLSHPRHHLDYLCGWFSEHDTSQQPKGIHHMIQIFRNKNLNKEIRIFVMLFRSSWIVESSTCSEVVAWSGVLSSRTRWRRGNRREIPFIKRDAIHQRIKQFKLHIFSFNSNPTLQII